MVDKCTKLINALSKSAKIDWGLNHEALRVIYKVAILPLLSYAVPVRIKALKSKSNRTKLVSVQRPINLKIAQVFRTTTSAEALIILTGLTSIIIKLEEISKAFMMMKKRQENINIDTPLELKDWHNYLTSKIQILIWPTL